MRTTLIVIVGLTLVLGGVGPALANHNSVGMQYGVGDPDPVPPEEPDVDDGFLPVYHTAGPDNEDGYSNDGPFFGSYPRLSPGDHTGLGYGEWIGYMNGVLEHPHTGHNQCLQVLAATPCQQANDPLYRANPDTDTDPECEQVENRLDPSQCDGQGHPWEITFWPPVRVQTEHYDVTGEEERNPGASGSMYGVTQYSFYLFLFGDGSGPAAGEEPFDYLETDLCKDHLATLKAQGKIPASRDTSAAEKCKLLTPQDIGAEDRTDRTRSDGTGSQHAAVCMGAPHFQTLSGASPVSACQDIMEFNQYFQDTESPFYVSNKPGWYIQSGFIDPVGATFPYDTGSNTAGDPVGAFIQTTMTKDGPREDVARIFSFYVNPVNVDDNLWCAAPLIATNAPDYLDTGITQNPDGSWAQSGDFHYIVEAHEIDVYTSPTTAPNQVVGEVDTLIGQATEDAGDLIAEFVPDDLPSPVAELVTEVTEVVTEVTDEASALANRADPGTGNDAEPQFPEDDAWRLSADTPPQRCSPTAGLQGDVSQPNKYYNYLQNTVSSSGAASGVGAAFHDYTYTDETGLPAETQDQNYNPWHPDRYTLGGSIFVLEDRNKNQAFDGCPAGQQPPTAANPDKCEARFPMDVYNPDAIRDDDRTQGEFARDNGFADPQGLYFVLNLTGPVVVTDEDVGTEDPETTEDRTRLALGVGQHCIVGTTTGLTDLGDRGQGERFRELLGLADDADEDEILLKLCGGVSGETHLIKDAFDDSTTAGSFSAALQWFKTMPGPHGLDLTEGDSVELNALITVQKGGDDLTRGNLDLGTNPDFSSEGQPTVAKVWGDDSVTYKWTDLDLFQSQPAE